MPKRWIHKAYTDQLRGQLFGIEQKYLEKETTLSMDILYDSGILWRVFKAECVLVEALLRAKKSHV